MELPATFKSRFPGQRDLPSGDRGLIDPISASGILFGDCSRTEFANGDILFEQTDRNFSCTITLLGMSLARHNPLLLALADRDFKRPLVPQKNIFTNGNQSEAVCRYAIASNGAKTDIAVKFIGKPSFHRPTGHDLYRTYRALQRRGILCAEPILATNEVFVSRWIEGDFPKNSEAFLGYLYELEKIVYTLKLGGHIDFRTEADGNRHDYKIIDEDASSPFARYISVDPVFYKPPTPDF